MVNSSGRIYDAKYDKFGSYVHRIYSHDDYFSVTWDSDHYFNELIEPYDFYKMVESKEVICVEDDSEKNRLFLRLKYGHTK